ncbi:regulatory protein, FmdB family [Pseudonocardia dioxanivorans CB1190]|uniref:Regulatory protein, FmdB family n=1 Tax=Pseudonocardia dioxanivorans (strain ATCC 55486 / DSM 44775 / JCM 13855 / CB1190) TaxID=675635 RepID=F4CP17_PSEUX|nr:FmdB family zinc ribbon protein [Pseudonocardia dioxanivorans]AEA23053.1 regulatory protein, FmdB family [Pseudonocardia dioxanivorans CB1190]
MPTYQYACTACDHRFEAVQSFSDDSLTVCPECGGPLRKVFSSVGIVFKGSGFYRTDSRGSSNGVAASSSESKSDSSSSTSSSDSGSTPQTVSGKPPKHGELVKTSGSNSASSSGSSPAA